MTSSVDLPRLLGCCILLLAGLGLLQLNGITFRKIGVAMIWLSTGLAVYFLFNSVLLACAMLLAWIFFPVWEMVFILRQLRVPRHRELADARPPRDEFEELADFTQALVDAGFENLDECHLKPVEHEQYYRIFMRQDGLVQATIGYIAQGNIGFHFIAFTSFGKDGRRWVTWDYPLTYGLVMPPNIAVYRALHCQDVPELYQAHLDFLEINEIKPEALAVSERTREAVRARLEETLNQQIEYNISRGYLAPASRNDSENFCYSWRGTLYVATQVLRDLLF
ncbi:MAG: hypothetical protein LV479_12910 [Methylacidiphilales bacterium]|nr:hypothetical protein [Candidatus Methylacidiphilales bacterium]